ncbi:MAG: type II toxin-antitoxin system HicA family toxin [Planctomycetaceae bacterium]|nr:type II toxin-antitoxin system HicA family toxin [Planctomycetaceae bacterium]
MKKKRLVEYLKSHGCYLVRQGEHEYWSSADGKYGAGVPRHVEIKTPTVRSICRSLHIPRPPDK